MDKPYSETVAKGRTLNIPPTLKDKIFSRWNGVHVPDSESLSYLDLTHVGCLCGCCGLSGRFYTLGKGIAFSVAWVLKSSCELCAMNGIQSRDAPVFLNQVQASEFTPSSQVWAGPHHSGTPWSHFGHCFGQTKHPYFKVSVSLFY